MRVSFTVDRAADAAPPAPKIVAALPAEKERGEAAARLEQDRLLPPRKNFPEPLDERPREERNALLLGAGRFAFEIHEGDARQRPVVHAGGQPQEAQPAVAGGLVRLHRGRGRAEHERRAGRAGADRRDVPRVVAGGLPLLVGPVVLLIDHEQAGIRDGREGGRNGGRSRRGPGPTGRGPRSVRARARTGTNGGAPPPLRTAAGAPGRRRASSRSPARARPRHAPSRGPPRSPADRPPSFRSP
jgi:hypothetical protein